KTPEDYNNLLDVPNILTQKFPAEEFMATTKLRLIGNKDIINERAGFAVVGEDYSHLFVRQEGEKQTLHFGVCKNGLTSGKETTSKITELENEAYIYLRVAVR